MVKIQVRDTKFRKTVTRNVLATSVFPHIGSAVSRHVGAFPSPEFTSNFWKYTPKIKLTAWACVTPVILLLP